MGGKRVQKPNVYIYAVGVHGPFGHMCTPKRKVEPLEVVNTISVTTKPNNAT
jgi:hypothetical protein